MSGKGVQLGVRYGKLVVISVEDDKVYKRQENTAIRYRRLKRYKVKCDCGNETIVFGQDLSSKKTQSCGSGTCSLRYYDDRTMPAFNTVYNTYKRTAIKRGLHFDIDVNTFRDMTKQECYYCGVKESNTQNTKTGTHIAKYTYNGLDRIDNSIGYIESNVVPCCNRCNHAKHTMSQSEFIALAIKIAQKHDH